MPALARGTGAARGSPRASTSTLKAVSHPTVFGLRSSRGGGSLLSRLCRGCSTAGRTDPFFRLTIGRSTFLAITVVSSIGSERKSTAPSGPLRTTAARLGPTIPPRETGDPLVRRTGRRKTIASDRGCMVRIPRLDRRRSKAPEQEGGAGHSDDDRGHFAHVGPPPLQRRYSEDQRDHFFDVPVGAPAECRSFGEGRGVQWSPRIEHEMRGSG